MAANVPFPSWAIQEIEGVIYAFLWDNKWPLLNPNMMALPLAKGSLNVPWIKEKLQAACLKTIWSLLSYKQANWKFLTSHFFCLSYIPTSKHTLVLNYTVHHHIDLNIPHFHRYLLIAWLHHNNHPVTLADILCIDLKTRWVKNVIMI